MLSFFLALLDLRIATTSVPATQSAETGLTGRYDFGLLWRPEVPLGGNGNNPPSPSDNDGLPDVYTAIHQQLGLRLEAIKKSTEVIVIDHLEKPSEN